MTDQSDTSPATLTETPSGSVLYEETPASINPLEGARGPWRASTQNGAAIAALMTSLMESTPTRAPMQPMNIAVVFARPVPFEPMQVEQRIVRDGAKIQIVQATLSVGGVESVIATMTRLRSGDSRASARTPPARPMHPETLPRYRPPSPFFQFVDCRPVSGGFEQMGPGAAWLRMCGQIIAGRPASPLACAMLFADAGSGLSGIVPRETWSYPNISLSLHLQRQPRSEWMLLDSSTHACGSGVAQVASTLSDAEGPFAWAQQALILERTGV